MDSAQTSHARDLGFLAAAVLGSASMLLYYKGTLLMIEANSTHLHPMGDFYFRIGVVKYLYMYI